MPKVTWNIPDEEKRIADDLRQRYAVGTLSLPQVQQELGLSRTSTVRWLADVPSLTVGKRLKYRAADVAHKIYMNIEL